jgi:hypothetical protein
MVVGEGTDGYIEVTQPLSHHSGLRLAYIAFRWFMPLERVTKLLQRARG